MCVCGLMVIDCAARKPYIIYCRVVSNRYILYVLSIKFQTQGLGEEASAAALAAAWAPPAEVAAASPVSVLLESPHMCVGTVSRKAKRAFNR